ncbi:MAG: phosphohistidine phosphatase SixA [Deltaproteobacteria bacterium]|nr:phosphohistidine phosphatase SixA [Deltaproteobacteria bacterium]
MSTTELEMYLVRHGIAEDASPDGSDYARALTAEGSANMRDEAAGLGRLKVRLDVILTSPLVRARQTAEVLAAHIGGKPSIVISPALATSGSPAAVMTQLRKEKFQGRIALVGHEPGMGELAAMCLGMSTPAPFKKGGVCRIDFDLPLRDATGLLRWFATPKMLIATGRAAS